MVRFKKDTHQYFTEDGEELISVSAFVKRFELKKDWLKIAKRKCASLKKYEGITKTPKELMKEWEMKRDRGSEAGTMIHSLKEAEVLNKEFYEYEQEKLLKKECMFDGTSKISIPINKLENGHIYPELMIYDLDHMICGQSDKVIVKGNMINVIDYKTDKTIDFKAYSSEWVKPEKLLKPISHLQNCNGNIYSIKMSLYMYLLWSANKGKLKPGKIILDWCPLERDEDGIPILYDGKPKIKFEKQIELPYRKKEVMAMLATLK